MAAAQGYIGRNPADASTVIARQSFSPTGIQTDFTFAAGYDVGHVDLYLNGVRLVEGQDFTATNGSTVGLTTNAVNGDVLELVAFKAFNATNVTTAGGDFTVGRNLTVSGTAEVTGAITATGGVVGNVTGNASGTAGGLTGTPDITVRHLKATGISTVSDTTQTTSITSGAFIVSGGVGIAKSLFVGGDMNIAGTLTYEDVTNVETAGITTTGGLVVTGLGATFGSGVGIADSIYHINDSNTAIRFPADDTVTVETAGSERVRITSGGRIGLGSDGTSSPASVLHVFSNSSDDTVKIQGPTSGGDYNVGFEVLRDTTAGGAKMIAKRNTSSGGVGWEWFTTADNTAEVNATYTSRMVLTEAGSIGIGTTNPAGTLEINAASTTSMITLDVAGTNFARLGHNSASGTDLLDVRSEGHTRFLTNGNNERLRITSGGVVVVGHNAATTSGASNNSNFNIVGNVGSATGEGQLNLWKRTDCSDDDVLGLINFCGDTTGDPGAIIKGEADADWNQGGDTSDHPSRLTFFTVPDNSSVAEERLRIGSNGFVGINETAPGAQLTVKRANTSTSGLSGVLKLKQGNATNGNRASMLFSSLDDFDVAAVNGVIETHSGTVSNNKGRLEFYTKNSGSDITERMRITSDGNVSLVADNQKLLLGAGDDLEIYHDGTDSYVDNSTGDLILRSTGDDVIIRASDDIHIQTAGSENAIVCSDNGNVALYFNGVNVFQTYNEGIVIIGPEGQSAGIQLQADEADDDGDTWRINSNQDANDLTIANNISGSQVDKLTLTNGGNLSVTGTVSDSIGNLRKLIANTQSGTYTLVAGDSGKYIWASGTVTVPNNVFSAGDMVTIVNDTNGNLTITNSLSVMYLSADGTNAASRTLGAYGMATLLFVSGTTAYISGAGLS